MRLLTIILILLTTTTFGQIVNTLSSDKTNMYFHGLDSLTSILKRANDIDLVIVCGDNQVVSNFPDTVSGIRLIKKEASESLKVKLKKNDALIVIHNVVIIRDQFTIRFTAGGQNGRLSDGLYTFYYKYIPDKMTYELRKNESGIRN